MATKKSGGARSSQDRRKSSSGGRNQRDSGWMASARDNPLAAAIGAAAAVGAGVFLWSRRDRISDQISDISEQLSEARGDDGSEERSQTEIAEEALTLKEIGAAS